jgi:hypothetical protein
LDGDKGVRGLAEELEVGCYFAEECAGNLARIENESIVGSINVLQVYLKYLNSIASELNGLLCVEGDAS